MRYEYNKYGNVVTTFLYDDVNILSDDVIKTRIWSEYPKLHFLYYFLDLLLALLIAVQIFI